MTILFMPTQMINVGPSSIIHPVLLADWYDLRMLYTYRVLKFFVMQADPTTFNKKAYANSQYNSTLGLLLAAGIAITMVKLFFEEWAKAW